MGGLFVSAVFVSAVLCGSAGAQDWIPPRPGQDTCSGFVKPDAQQRCRDKDADIARQAERGRAAVAAEQAHVEAEAAANAEASRLRDAERRRVGAAALATTQGEAETKRQADAAAAAALAEQAQKRQEADRAELASRRDADPKRIPFDFKADHFGTLMLHTSELHGRPVWPRLALCRDETDARPGVCAYSVSESVSLGVANAMGTDRPDKVIVTWNGDPFGARTVAQVARALGYVLSPGVQDGSQDAMAAELLGLLHRHGSGVPEKQWTIGSTLYSIGPDPHLGSRGDVLFTAIDRTAK